MFQEQDGWFSNFQETMSENAPDHLQILQNHQVSEFESIPVPSLPEFLKAALTVRIEFAPAVRIMQVAWKLGGIQNYMPSTRIPLFYV